MTTPPGVPSPTPVLGQIEFATVHQPVVSIIVCAHNQFAITAGCLSALQVTQRWNHTTFEIVLVDDASTDAVPSLRQISGITYVRLEPNRGFLRAANAGVAAARGEHIVFLNNDTEPQGTWLDELVDTLVRRPRAGVVGARLVYPDGRVQEAGGIVFDNAAGWNYGRLGAFDDPRITFERQVDYCSGAALLVRGELLRGLGGFDERFAPAYYEDTDLCFAARAHGFEVWYQPDAIVVHLEGASHGTDTSSGVKAHQVANQERFRDKWREQLAEQFPPEAQSVPLARSRRSIGHILVIDNEVPAPDLDSGSRRLTEVLRTMLHLGYGVTYLPANGWRRPPYTRALERMGVEVLGGALDRWALVHEIAAGLTHAWVARPHVAEALLPRLRAEFPHVRLLYDTVDLHFLREERGAALTQDAALLARAAETGRTELAIANTVDAVVVVSPIERHVLAQRTKTPIFVVPNIHPLAPERPHVPASHDLLFVGGFRHPPNVDGILWFVREILPRLRALVPTARLLIVGSSVPQNILELASDAVEVVGWVPDVTPLYLRVRAAVAPLRYGAGVKGKVGEAMALGVPTVLTSIAAEGMHVESEVHALVADAPDAFAAHLGRLLTDDGLWQKLSTHGRTLIADRFSPEAVTTLLDGALRGREIFP